MIPRFILVVAICVAHAVAQTTITELKLRVEPEARKVRPHEGAVVQVQVIGTIADPKTGTRTGRLQRDGWKASAPAGWITKPFKYQGTDDATFLDAKTSAFAQLLGRQLGQYTIKDSFLYIAPEAPGKYTLTVELEGKKSEVEIEVAAGAPSTRTVEKQTFAPEQSGADPYRRIAEHYAPFVAQETWFQPKSDYLARFDYDGDWRGDNNWDNLEAGSSQAYVHYAAVETPTHVFLHYNFFHPRDYSDNCLMGACHENDNEGIVLTVQKDGSEFGRLQVMETLAHNNVYTYVNDGSLRPGVHDIDGPIPFWKDTHPIVFLESGGHGAYSAGDRRAAFAVDRMQFTTAGVTYVYKGAAERPRHPCDSEVGYELLPIYDHWWLKSSSPDWREPTFDDYFEYQPFGRRPLMKNRRISGAFLGRKHDMNKARPFWGWFDMRGRKANVTNSGQWALDPAYSVSRHLRLPQQQKFSLDYTFNPYLDIAVDGPRASMAAPDGFVAATPVDPSTPVAAAVPAAPPAGSPDALRSAGVVALGNVLGGGNNSAIGAAMQRIGIGAGAADALKQITGGSTAPTGAAAGAATGECTVTASAASAGDLTVRGDLVEAAQGVSSKLSCAAPLPQSDAAVRVETTSGPAPVTVTEQPNAANKFGLKLRLDKPGDYQIVLRW